MACVLNAPEFVPHTTVHVSGLIELFKNYDFTDDPALRRDFFVQLDEDDFIDTLQLLAAHVRGDTSGNLQYFDGDGVTLTADQTMDHRDKEAWLRLAWSIAQSSLFDNSLDDQTSLDYAGLTIAGAVQFIHPFRDGNGRTGRVLANLIMNPMPDAIAEIVGSEDGRTIWALPLTRLNGGRKYSGSQPDTIHWYAPDADIDDGITSSVRDVEQPTVIDAFDGLVSTDFNRDDIIRDFLDLYPHLMSFDQSTGSLNALSALETLAQSTDTATKIFSARALGQIRRANQSNSTRAFLAGILSDETYLIPEQLRSAYTYSVTKHTLPPSVHYSMQHPSGSCSFIDQLRTAHYVYSRAYKSS